jgi:TRAP-type C4-dicarboxylate transport system substrate-binding protein
MKKTIIFILIGVVFIVTLSFISSISVAAEIELKAVSFQPRHADRTKVFLMLIDAINERAKGKLKVKYLGGPEVIPSLEQGFAIKKGVADMTTIPSAFYEGLVPGVLMLGASQISVDEERKRGVHDIIAKMHEKAGLFYMGRGDTRGVSQFAMVLRNKKVDKLSDLVGLKLGGTTVHVKGFAKELGMTFVLTKFSEVYPGLSRGVFDAFSNPPGTYVALGAQKAVKYMIDHYYLVSNIANIMNLKTWNGLTKDLQKIILETVKETEPKIADYLFEADKKARKAFLDAGVEFVKFSPTEADKFVSIAYRSERERLIEAYPIPEVKELSKLMTN